MSHAGRFVWRELVVPSPSQVASFYAGLFGWQTKSIDMGQAKPYTMFHQAEDVGGATVPSMAGMPPQWLNYVTVDDVDAALARVKALGGRAITEAMDLPVGRFAVVADPSGAELALFRSVTPGASHADRRPPVGTFCWSQLMTDNVDGVVPFYTQVFGWTAVPQDGGGVWFMDGDTARASALVKPTDAKAPNHWLAYIAVEDTDAAFAQAQALGARTLVTPTDVSGMGRFAVLGDPSGATFALWTHAES